MKTYKFIGDEINVDLITDGIGSQKEFIIVEVPQRNIVNSVFGSGLNFEQVKPINEQTLISLAQEKNLKLICFEQGKEPTVLNEVEVPRSLMDLEIGENLKGGVIKFINTELPVPAQPVSPFPQIRLGNTTGISFYNDRSIRFFNQAQSITLFNGSTGIWVATELQLPNIDLPVLSNNLPIGSVDYWGFDFT